MRTVLPRSWRLGVVLSLVALVLGGGAWIRSSAPALAGGGKDIPRVTVTAREGAIDAPAAVPTGVVAITYQNTSRMPFFGVVIRLNEGVTPAAFFAVIEDIEAALRLASVVGGPAFLAPGGSQEIVYDLRAGTHVIVSFEEEADDVISATFRATPPSAANEPPEAVGEIVMGDFFFRAPAIPAGTNRFRVTNSGRQLHHMLVFRLAPGATLQQALAAEEEGIDPVEAGLVAPVNGLSELSPGQSAWPTLSFTPGAYVMICFIEDPATGREHADLGMIQEFTVR